MNKDIVRDLFEYDPETGIFRRKVNTGSLKAGTIANSITQQGYKVISVNYKVYKQHRLAFLYMLGRWPKCQVDHINHDRGDNRWKNLREVSKVENNRNTSLTKRNTSGVVGISKHTKSGRWACYISVKGKNIYLGCFEKLNDAIKARKDAEIKHGFHKNHGKAA